jgi:Domain of unknown function (DUF4258)
MGTLHHMPKRIRLSIESAQQRVRQIAWESGDVIFTGHAEQRMEERGISIPEVLELLRGGYIDDPPRLEVEGEWKCKVAAKLRGRTAGVVTVILDEAGQLIIVTVEWEDYR